jgi:heptosyltransferase III
VPPFLLVRAGGLGDVLLLHRAVATLRAGGHCVWLLAPERHGCALLDAGGVERVIDWEGPGVAALLRGEGPAGPLADSLRACAAAIVYSSNSGLVSAIAQLVPHTVSHSPLPAGGLHAAQWYTQPVLAFVTKTVELTPFRATVDEARRAAELLAALELPAAYVAVHPGSGSPAKNWPLPRFAALAEAVSCGRPWLLVEGPAEIGSLETLRRVPGARVASGVPPRVLGAALARAGTYVGNDSGVTHLAASWGAPVLALFGPTDPRSWAPVGPQVSILRAPGGDLSTLALDDVVGAVRRLGRRDGTLAVARAAT